MSYGFYAPVSVEIDAGTSEDQFSGDFTPPQTPQNANFGKFSLSVSGVSDTTVTLQRKFGVDGTYRDVKTFSADAEETVEEAAGDVHYRIGAKSGDLGTESSAILAMLKK